MLRLKIKYLLYILVFLVSCNQKETRNTVDTNVQERNRSDSQFDLDNGVLFYKKEPYSGIVNSFYKTGELKAKSVYFKGKRNGFYNGWYENGDVFFERFYKNGFKYGEHKGWYKNGQLSFVYYFNELGEYNGEIKEWYENGQLLRAFNYVKGREEGNQKMWQPNGKIRANYVTKNGERFGLIGLKKCYTINTENEVIQ